MCFQEPQTMIDFVIPPHDTSHSIWHFWRNKLTNVPQVHSFYVVKSGSMIAEHEGEDSMENRSD